MKKPKDMDSELGRNDERIIFEDIKSILSSDVSLEDPNCISLYDVNLLIGKKQEGYYDAIHTAEHHFDYVFLAMEVGDEITFDDFDYNTNVLTLSLQTMVLFPGVGSSGKVKIKRINGELKVIDITDGFKKEIVKDFEDTISELYNKLLRYRDFKEQSVYNLEPCNSNFLVNINSEGIAVKRGKFKLSHNPRWCSYDCINASNRILRKIGNNEDEIFRSIYVRIEDCPKWSQEKLYQMRQEQLENLRDGQVKRGKTLRLKK